MSLWYYMSQLHKWLYHHCLQSKHSLFFCIVPTHKDIPIQTRKHACKYASNACCLLDFFYFNIPMFLAFYCPAILIFFILCSVFKRLYKHVLRCKLRLFTILKGYLTWSILSLFFGCKEWCGQCLFILN